MYNLALAHAGNIQQIDLNRGTFFPAMAGSQNRMVAGGRFELPTSGLYSPLYLYHKALFIGLSPLNLPLSTYESQSKEE